MRRLKRPLLILPDFDRVEDELLRRAKSDRDFVDASRVLSLGQLIDRLFDEAQAPGNRASPLVSRMVIWACAQGIGEGPFGSFALEPAFARAAERFILELKSAAAAPAEISRAAEAMGSTKLGWLSTLYDRYLAKLSELRLLDREDVIELARKVLDSRRPIPWLDESSTIEVRGIYDFTPSRLSLIWSLARRCEGARIDFLLRVPGAGSAAIDAMVDPTLAFFENRAKDFRYVQVEKEVSDPADRPISHPASELFSVGQRSDGVSNDPELTAWSAAHPRDEARLIAFEVANLVEQGTPPDRIAIAYRDLGDEAERLQSALTEVGLEGQARRGRPLWGTTAGHLALTLPSLVDDGFVADRMSGYLISRHFSAVAAMGSSPASVFSLASIRDDRLGATKEGGAYRVRLNRLIDRLTQAGRHRKAEEVEAVRDRTLRLIEIAQRLPPVGPLSLLLERWGAILAELGFGRAQPGRVDPERPEGDGLGRAALEAEASDLGAIEAIDHLRSEFARALAISGADGRRVGRRTFQRWLIDVALDHPLPPTGVRSGAVRILDLREVGLRTLDHLFIGGMIDGRVPKREEGSTLLSDEEKTAINQQAGKQLFRIWVGDPLSRLPWSLAEDRLIFHQALVGPSRGVTLSHARIGQDGRDALASPFLDEVERVFGLRIEHRPLCPVLPLDQVRSEQYLRERLAATLGSSAQPDFGSMTSEAWLAQAMDLAKIELERRRFFADPSVPPGPYSGLIEAQGEMKALLARAFAFGPDRPISVSGLKDFGNCAFQGFLAQVVGLEDPENPGEEIDDRQRGSFWHKVLEELMPRLDRAGLLGKPAREVPEAVIEEAIDAAMAEVETRGHLGHPALWRINRARARSMVRRLLRASHHGLPFDRLLPSVYELSFGDERAPANWRHVAIEPLSSGDPIHLRGRIDRFDEGSGAAGVIDYKLSVNQPRVKEQLLTTELQLSLYLYAARRSGQRGQLDAVWLSLKDGETLRLSEVLRKAEAVELGDFLADDPTTRRTARELGRTNLANLVEDLVTGLRQGRFAARPQDCEWCAFRAVCRIRQPEVEDI